MMNESEYQNLIALLKQTLEFYGNVINYEPESDIIEKDMGAQARFALQRVQDFGGNQQDNIEEYIKQVEENVEGNEDVDDLYKTLQEVKKLANKEINKMK